MGGFWESLQNFAGSMAAKDAPKEVPKVAGDAKIPEAEAGKVEVKDDTARALEAEKSKNELAKLKGVLTMESQELAAAIELRGTEFKEISIPLNEAIIGQKIAAVLDQKNLDPVVNFAKSKGVEASAEAVKAVLQVMYTHAVMGKIQAGVPAKYDKFIEQYPENTLICNVKMGSGSIENPEFIPKTSGKTFEVWKGEYDAFAAKLPVDPEKSVTVPEVEPKDNPKVRALEGSLMAKAAVLFGFLKSKESFLAAVVLTGDPDVDKAAKEEAENKYYAQWLDVVEDRHWLTDIVLFFGGSHLLSADVKRTAKDVLEKIPQEYRGAADQLVKKASWLSLEKVKIKGAVEETLEAIDLAKFREILADSSKMPPKDFEIKNVYEFGKNGNLASLKIDLTGGEMILPAGSLTNVQGEPIKAPEKEGVSFKGTSSTKEFTITDNIPKGTIFKGKVKFVLDQAAA